MRAHERSGERDPAGERGGAAIEFALVLPIFLLLVVAMLFLGQALSVRAALAGAVYSAARTCTLGRDPTQACANRVVTRRMGVVATGQCDNLTVTAANQAEPGFNGVGAVQAFQVTASCAQSGWFSRMLQAQTGSRITNVRALAVMPF